MDFVYVVPLITALVEVVKRAGTPHNFLPLVAIGFGVAYSVFSNTALTFDVVIFGVTVGLSAVGLFEGVKKPVSKGVETVKKMM